MVLYFGMKVFGRDREVNENWYWESVNLSMNMLHVTGIASDYYDRSNTAINRTHKTGRHAINDLDPGMTVTVTISDILRNKSGLNLNVGVISLGETLRARPQNAYQQATCKTSSSSMSSITFTITAGASSGGSKVYYIDGLMSYQQKLTVTQADAPICILCDVDPTSISNQAVHNYITYNISCTFSNLGVSPDSPISGKGTLVFDSRGLGSTIQSLTYNIGCTFYDLYGWDLPKPTPGNSSFQFSGWYYDSAYERAVGTFDKLTTTQTILYAKWTSVEQKVTVSFNSNGGSSCSSRQYTVGSAYGTLPEPTKSGSTFEGWYSDAALTKRVYASTTVSSSVTMMYAKWETIPAATYTVTYKPGSYGTGSQQTATKAQDVALTLKGEIFSRTGYTQTGWSRSASGSTKDYGLGEQYTINADITLYPYWSDSSQPGTFEYWTVTYNSGLYGTGDGTYQCKFKGEGLTLCGARFTRTGYTQTGWSTHNDGSTKDYDLGEYYTVNASLQLYPYWSQMSTPRYNVTYNPGSGNGAVQTDVKIHDVPLKLKGALFTRSGYTQTAWESHTSTSVAGGWVNHTARYDFNSSYTNNADITLYPSWVGNEYVVTLDLQGGSGGTESVIATCGKSMPSITPPTRTGYTFCGYYASIGGRGTKYYSQDGRSASAWDQAGATILYAQWNDGSQVPKFTIENRVLKSVDLNGCTDVAIPSGVTNIGYSAFYGCRELKCLTIPDSVKSIESRDASIAGTFQDCRNLEEITIGKGVVRIESGAFVNCTALGIY